MEELKKCPFCGNSATLHKWSIKVWYVECDSCISSTTTASAPSTCKQEAIKAWNTRHNTTEGEQNGSQTHV